MQRIDTKQVLVGSVPIGGKYPVSVQSMTTVDTKDLESLSAQIGSLAKAGCDLVRVALYDRKCAQIVPQIVERSSVPVIGDVHFDAEIAVCAIENGIHKVRINPGNIGGEDDVRRVADAARAHGVPIRVGANSGSLPARESALYEKQQAQALVAAALDEVRQLEKMHFDDIVISIKSSSVPVNVEAARMMRTLVPYPLHLGVTEAGTAQHAVVKSAVGIGTLLMEGIGDTIRVSISGDPLREVKAARQILQACGLERAAVEIISCPTCARCGIDVEEAAGRVEKMAAGCKQPITIAVMGCAVNGPGEARRADVGIAGAPSGAVLFENGEVIRTVRDMPEAYEALAQAIARHEQTGGEGTERSTND